jgi:CheY-like chemotaxis protein
MMPELTHRLLLVEDNPGDALLVAEALSEITNYKLALEEVTSLKQASAALESNGFDGIILDLTLPDSTGIETLSQMRAFSPETPIIVLTGLDARGGLREKAEQFGAFEFVSKNELSQLLPRSVHWALRHKRAELQHRQFERLMRSIPDAVIVTDRAAVICFVNDAALELYGKQNDDLVGLPLGCEVKEGASLLRSARCGVRMERSARLSRAGPRHDRAKAAERRTAACPEDGSGRPDGGRRRS